MSRHGARRVLPCPPLSIYSSRTRRSRTRRPRQRPHHARVAAFVLVLWFALPAAGRLSAERESVRPSTLRSREPDPQPRAIESAAIALVSAVAPTPVERDAGVAFAKPAEAGVSQARSAHDRKAVGAARVTRRVWRAPARPSPDVSPPVVLPGFASYVSARHPQFSVGVGAMIGPR